MSHGTIKAVLSGDTVILIGERASGVARCPAAGKGNTHDIERAVCTSRDHTARRDFCRAMVCCLHLNPARPSNMGGVNMGCLHNVPRVRVLQVPTVEFVPASFLCAVPTFFLLPRSSRRPWAPSRDAAVAGLPLGTEARPRSRHRRRAVRLGLPRVLAQEVHRKAGG